MTNKKTILIVDDEKALREALSEKFKSEGFEVITSADGEEGLKKALNMHPDIILLDVMMPKMDGIKVMEKLQKDIWGKTARVIMLTNVSDPIKVAEATEAGSKNMTIYDYMIKSDWKLEEVVDKVKSKLGM